MVKFNWNKCKKEV